MPQVVPQFQQRAFGYSDALAIDQASTLPTGEAFTAGLDQSLDRNPAGSLARWSDELYDISQNEDAPWYERIGASIGSTLTSTPIAGMTRAYKRITGEKTKFLTAEEANEQYGIEGRLTFNGQVSERVAADMKRLKIREMEQQWTLDNVAPGLLGNGAALAGGFVGSAFDPINIATSALPLGWFRGLGVVASLGKSSPLAAEILTQALQGAAGAALVEPIVASRAWREQADYTAADSAINILFGAGLGAAFPAFDAALRSSARIASRSVNDLTTSRILSDFSEGGVYRDSRTYFSEVKTPSILPPVDTGIPASGADYVEWVQRIARDEANPENAAIAQQMANRLRDEDLNSAVANLTPNKIQAAVNSARQIYNELASANIPAKEKAAAMAGLRKFVDDVNGHEGYQAFTPLPERKTSSLGDSENLTDFLGRLHPAVDAVGDAIEKLRDLKDVTVTRVTKTPTLDNSINAASPRQALSDRANQAIFEHMNARIDAGQQSLSSAEILNIANLDPQKVRADIESGRNLSLAEYKEWTDGATARLAADSRSPAQIANDEKALRQLVEEEVMTRAVNWKAPDISRTIIPSDPISKPALAALDTSDTAKLAAAAKEEAEGLEKELMMPADAEGRKLMDEFLKDADDEIANLPNIKSIADQLLECVLTP